MRFLVVLTLIEKNSNIIDLINSIKESTSDTDILVINSLNSYRTEMMLINNDVPHINTAFRTSHQDSLSIGFQYAIDNKYEGLVEFDASGELDPKDIPYLISTYKNQKTSFVFGSRFKNFKSKKLKRSWRARFLSWFIKITTKKIVSDPGFPFILYGKEVFKHFDQKSYWKVGPDSIAYLLRNGYTYSEIQINCDRKNSLNHKSLSKSFWETWFDMLSIFFVQPLRRKERR